MRTGERTCPLDRGRTTPPSVWAIRACYGIGRGRKSETSGAYKRYPAAQESCQGFTQGDDGAMDSQVQTIRVRTGISSAGKDSTYCSKRNSARSMCKDRGRSIGKDRVRSAGKGRVHSMGKDRVHSSTGKDSVHSTGKSLVQAGTDNGTGRYREGLQRYVVDTNRE